MHFSHTHTFQSPMRHNSTREPPLSEMAVTRLLRERAEQDGAYLNFIGAGAYEHHIPAVVSQLVARGYFCANAAARGVVVRARHAATAVRIPASDGVVARP